MIIIVQKKTKKKKQSDNNRQANWYNMNEIMNGIEGDGVK